MLDDPLSTGKLRRRCQSYARLALGGLLITLSLAKAQAVPPVPASPYISIVYQYADALLAEGRDIYGPEQTQLLLSALDLAAPRVLNRRPSAPAHVAEAPRVAASDGPLVGCCPAQDENVLRIFYLLSELSNRPTYRQAADAELVWLLHRSQVQGGAPLWESEFAWNALDDVPIERTVSSDSSRRSWLLWEPCFAASPAATTQIARQLRDTPFEAGASPRHYGARIRSLAMAYQFTKDDSFLTALDAVLGNLEARPFVLSPPADGLAATHPQNSAAWLSAAIDCGGAASRTGPVLGKRIRAQADRIDADFCALAHKVAEHNGFMLSADDLHGEARTTLWPTAGEAVSTAALGMLCVSRYENTGDVRFRGLIQAAADAYQEGPPSVQDVWPLTFGHAISLELAAWRSTSNKRYLDRAVELADLAVKTFWNSGPLPRASAASDHYETITGADSLALALVELHLSILHITAVRPPPNTIDR